jgi:L-histidine N-alpha-methyltransferase
MAVSRTTESSRRMAVREFLEGTRRLGLLAVPGEDLRERMRREVLTGLSDPVRRSIPPAYLYDARGSELYERITELPEYYPARTEASLLRQIAPLLAERLELSQLVELGSGSSVKTRLLLDAFQACDRPLTYIPIDISRSMLAQSAQSLSAAYPGMRVLGLAASFEEALALLPDCAQRLVIFLGGTLGNLSPIQQDAFFAGLRAAMPVGNHLLLGFDCRAHAGKPAPLIHAAYNDAQEVTAAFNLNLLRRLNRELGADFRLERWLHRAEYVLPEHQIEMVLVSLEDQEVRVAGQAYRFRKGEGILTEISRKFDPLELAAWLDPRGFSLQACWMDPGASFGLMLLRRVDDA